MDEWNWKKLKGRYTKLIFFKVYEIDCKSDERSEIVSDWVMIE
jgi:hypothetical protein